MDKSLSTAADELIIQADLGLLYDILGEFADVAMLFEESRQMAHLIMKLNRFCDIHKVRCHDLLTIKKKVDDARGAYQSLQLKSDGYKHRAEQYQKLYEQLLESKI